MARKLNPQFTKVIIKPAFRQPKQSGAPLRSAPLPPPPKKSFWFSILLLILFPLILFWSVTNILNFTESKLNIKLLSANTLLKSLGADINPLKTDSNNRTTVLVIGIDRGEGRFYTYNTDTIMTLTYDHNTHQLFMISYPRDLYVKIPNTRRTYQKINAVYYYGTINGNQGVEYLKQVIKEISGLEVHYYLIVDFDGFRALIDELGGITINNPRAFTDRSYPKPGGGYMTVSFEAGEIHLNGEQALQYARSRKAPGPEGSDYARALRQQRIIQGLLETLVNQLKKNPLLVNKLLNLSKKYLEYSTVSWEEISYATKLYLNKGLPQMYSLVLQPKVGNFRLLRTYALPLFIIAPTHGLGEWYFIRLFIEDYFKYPNFITNLPTYAYLVQCDDKQAELAKTLKYRLFYLPFKRGSTKYCELAIGNTVLIPQEHYSTEIGEELSKLTGFEVKAAEVPGYTFILKYTPSTQ